MVDYPQVELRPNSKTCVSAPAIASWPVSSSPLSPPKPQAAPSPPTTLEFADSIFNDWTMATIILGALLAMAMIGASYLVRDERLINLLWDMGAEE